MWNLQHLALLLIAVGYANTNYIRLEPNTRYVYKFTAVANTEKAGGLRYMFRVNVSFLRYTG